MIFTITATASPGEDELTKYRELASQGEQLNEDYLAAKDDLASKQAELDKANQNLLVAAQLVEISKVNERAAQLEVDKITSSSFVSLSSLSRINSLLTASSSKEFLERGEALDSIASDKTDLQNKLKDATNIHRIDEKNVQEIKDQAQRAKNTATRLVADIEAGKKALAAQIEKIDLAKIQLSNADRAELKDIGVKNIPIINAPSQKAQIAIDAALSRLGKPYVWGATGPNTFDCSGLMFWSYLKAGITLPRVSRAQATFGQSVSLNALLPGDLVFYHSPVSHVAMYLGEGRIVQAPTTGDVVKISPIGSAVSARRVT